MLLWRQMHEMLRLGTFFRQINQCPREIAEFEARGKRLWGGFGLAPNYVEQGKIFAFYDREGRMIGGFSLILEPPLRTLQGMSEVRRRELLATHPASDLLEAYAVWLDPASKTTRRQISFWLEAVRQAVESGRKYMILGYNGEAAGLKSFWRDAGFSLVERVRYVDQRFDTHQHAEIVIGRIAGLPWALVRYSIRRIRRSMSVRRLSSAPARRVRSSDE